MLSAASREVWKLRAGPSLSAHAFTPSGVLRPGHSIAVGPGPRWANVMRSRCRRAAPERTTARTVANVFVWPGPPVRYTSGGFVAPWRAGTRWTSSLNVPGTLPERSTGTAIIAHWTPFGLAHGLKSSAADAGVGAAAATTRAATIAIRLIDRATCARRARRSRRRT